MRLGRQTILKYAVGGNDSVVVWILHTMMKTKWRVILKRRAVNSNTVFSKLNQVVKWINNKGIPRKDLESDWSHVLDCNVYINILTHVYTHEHIPKHTQTHTHSWSYT